MALTLFMCGMMWATTTTTTTTTNLLFLWHLHVFILPSRNSTPENMAKCISKQLTCAHAIPMTVQQVVESDYARWVHLDRKGYSVVAAFPQVTTPASMPPFKDYLHCAIQGLTTLSERRAYYDDVPAYVRCQLATGIAHIQL